MRQKIVAGNWKMNLLANDARELLLTLNDNQEIYNSNVEVIVAPPTLYLSEFSRIIGFDDNIDYTQNVENVYQQPVSVVEDNGTWYATGFGNDVIEQSSGF